MVSGEYCDGLCPDTAFLFTIGGLLLTIENFCLHLCLGVSLLAIGALLLAIVAFLLTSEVFGL